ncbi:MAG: APC family permease [Candidatus Aenigmatarchaeota archaeon]
MKGKHYKLKKDVGLLSAVFYGVGIILGAGIYALLGVGAGMAGNAIWISFAIAAIIATFTGLTYAELSSRYPKEAAEYVYTKHAFNRKMLSFVVEWIFIVIGIISAATVSLGFANYFTHIFGGEVLIVAAVLIALLSILNYIGIKDSARFTILSTIIEMGGLVIIVLIGIFFFKPDINFFEMPESGFFGVLSATALIFFAYIGFEEVVNVSEETKNAKKIMPRALLISLVISTILYILVSIAAVSVVGWETLATSKAPLTEVASQAFGVNAGLIMSIIALFATSNTVLVTLIVVSRLFYGLANNRSFPHACARIGKRGTPYISVFLAMALVIAALFIGNLKTVALLTDIGIFTIYILINLSLIFIRFHDKKEPPFKSPVNIGRFPVLALLGLLSAAAMFAFFDPMLILFEIGVIIVGAVAYKVFNR